MDAESLHKAMLNPEAYPEETGPVTFRETHISRLYFTTEHVYKVKKRVDFGFLNFTTLDRRRFYCQEELRLNSRFCPHTYLEIVEIRQHEKGCRVGGKAEGEVVDYAVRMKRLPQDRMLDILIENQSPGLDKEMERLGHHIGRLHLGSESRQHIGGRSSADLMTLNWEENLRQTEPFVDSTLAAPAQTLMTAYVDRFLKSWNDLLLQRERSGHVIDGHGDLHAEHICLCEPICIYDCIEFNERFRVGDRLLDLAFLLMDLEHRNRADLADTLFRSYLETVGPDPDASTLLPFYKIYRAWVRGKVFSFLACDPTADTAERNQAFAEAQSYFSLALSYLCSPTLVLTCGLMGAGKTTLAAKLAQFLKAPVLRSDEIRKELAGMTPQDRDYSGFGGGIYAEEMSEKTYRVMLKKAEAQLSRGQSVIADASFALNKNRNEFRELAAKVGIGFRILWMTCDETTLQSRLRGRQTEQTDASDGREELLDRQIDHFQSPGQEPDVIKIDTGFSIDGNIQLILCDLAEKMPESRTDN